MTSSLKLVAVVYVTLVFLTGCGSTNGGKAQVSDGVYYGAESYDPWYYGPGSYPPDVIVTPPEGPGKPPPIPTHPIAPTPSPRPTPMPSIPSTPRPAFHR